jgi:hypothetical protein
MFWCVIDIGRLQAGHGSLAGIALSMRNGVGVNRVGSRKPGSRLPKMDGLFTNIFERPEAVDLSNRGRSLTFFAYHRGYDMSRLRIQRYR